MKVEIWSDVACPFCYIGERKFEEALKDFSDRDQVEIEFKSFQLDPNAKKNTDLSMDQVLAKKYRVSEEQAKNMNAQVADTAKMVGLSFQMDKIKPTNTLDAHRLSHYAKEKGKMKEMMERLLKAYFTEGLNVGDHETLVSLAEEVGFQGEDVLSFLRGNQYADVVIAEQQEGSGLGVQGVPFFVFDRKYAVSGAQDPKAFLEVLEKVKSEQEPKLTVLSDKEEGNACSDGHCNI
ncbi:DsbA family oxidoreductase [Alkalihalobacillus trypoxylicola]|uniref:Disulfide bond formation protein DsbA n=1 Tax=Alkalihalobacillus trypoxylicola TaxID=519424 RepID=A0A162DEN9_9BACI|nr:DsbA family oxidoreductase [Alkalihalobacillus trypoxylicola]KYG29397.1 disulfide bond formation protein DsbA [Alkalihalobacillus trypoxylicola]